MYSSSIASFTGIPSATALPVVVSGFSVSAHHSVRGQCVVQKGLLRPAGGFCFAASPAVVIRSIVLPPGRDVVYTWTMTDHFNPEISLYQAIDQGRLEDVERLLEHAEGFLTQEGKNGMLAYCAEQKRSEAMNLLLLSGADPQAAPSAAGSLLDRAVSALDFDQSIALLVAGANPNYRDEAGNYSLSRAALADNPVMIELLLRNGTDIDHPNLAGKTPLALACERGSIQAAVCLIHHGASLTQAHTGKSILAKAHPDASAVLHDFVAQQSTDDLSMPMARALRLKC